MKYFVFLLAAILLAGILVLPAVHGAVQAEPAITPTLPAAAYAYLPMVRSLGKAPAGNPTVTPPPTASATPLYTPTTTPTQAATPAPMVTLTPTATPTETAVPAHSNWAIESRPYRVLTTVNMNGTARSDKVAEFVIDFTGLLTSAGENGKFDANSLRVVEVDAKNHVLNNNVPFQFDPDAFYNTRSSASGTMAIMLEGSSNGRSSRQYHVYFDKLRSSPAAPVSVAPRVTLSDGVEDEGWDSYAIQTDAATYFYHKEGGGFSSLIDAAGNDWIDYKKAAGATGDFRGIPNLVHPENGGYFHPGRSGVISSVVSEGPLKVTIHSTTADEKWQTLWDIYPDHARLTVLEADSSYWFLYEGTPGGLLEPKSDFVVRSNGTKRLLSRTWQADLPAPEWVYFGDPDIDRSLYFVHHEDDKLVDSYFTFADAMTVFGFGRDGAARRLTEVPSHFTLGFVDETDSSTVEAALNNAYEPLNISVGINEQQPGSMTVEQEITQR